MGPEVQERIVRYDLTEPPYPSSVKKDSRILWNDPLMVHLWPSDRESVIPRWIPDGSGRFLPGYECRTSAKPGKTRTERGFRTFLEEPFR